MKSHRRIREMIVFAMLGALMFASKLVFEFLPNIHPLAMFIMVFTIVYRVKALIPIYVFVILLGAYYGFAIWWIPYLYIWAILWALTMILPKNLPKKIAIIVYPVVCSLFGLAYGTLYAPAQAILFGYDFSTTVKWIISGLPFDVIHAIGNIGMGLLIYPLSVTMKKIDKKSS